MKTININYILVLAIVGMFYACTSSTTPEASTNPTSQALKDSSIYELPEEINSENHTWVMDKLIGKPKYDIKKIGILVYNGCNILDVMGPRYVLGQCMGAQTQLIGLAPGNIKTVMGIELVPNTVIDSVDQLDILVIPGGYQGTILACYDEKLHSWIRMIDEQSVFTSSVCTGAWILGGTGLLEGRRATTNWYRAEEMLSKYGASFVEKRYVRDDKYWTAAGVTAGMDMSLAMLQSIWGPKYTQAVMLDMEYDPDPPVEGGSPDKTGFIVYQMMKAMYDMGAQPLLDSLDNL